MAIAPLYRPLVEVANERGVDVRPILARLGLTDQELSDPDVRLTPEQGRAFWSEVSARVGDPEIGLRLAERFRPQDADLLGYLALHVAHPLAALEMLTRYSRLLGDTADFKLHRRGALVILTLGRTGGRMLLHEGSDYAAGAVARFVQQVSDGGARPIEVSLPRPRPPRTAGFRRFFRAPVVFGAQCASLTYSEASLLIPFAASDTRLVDLLTQPADAALAAIPPPAPLLDRARFEISRRLSASNGDANGKAAKLVAERLRCSPRTLRRRLAAQGQSYRALLDEARHERARALLDDPRQSITAIAHLVGFSDPTSFARAFRRWTGLGPSQYRRRSRA